MIVSGMWIVGKALLADRIGSGFANCYQDTLAVYLVVLSPYLPPSLFSFILRLFHKHFTSGSLRVSLSHCPSLPKTMCPGVDFLLHFKQHFLPPPPLFFVPKSWDPKRWKSDAPFVSSPSSNSTETRSLHNFDRPSKLRESRAFSHHVRSRASETC